MSGDTASNYQEVAETHAQPLGWASVSLMRATTRPQEPTGMFHPRRPPENTAGSNANREKFRKPQSRNAPRILNRRYRP